MRVLTYNIHGWRGTDERIDVDRLVRIIRSSQADVVGLNEVFHPFTAPDDRRPALDRLAAALGMSYAFGISLTPQFAFAPSSSYGNALLARYPVLAHAGHHLTPVEGHEQRGLLETRVLLDDGRTPLSIYVTHLDHRSEEARLQQLAAVFQWTGRDRSRPHLLMGDFNALAPADYDGRSEALEALGAHERGANLVKDGVKVVPRVLARGYVDAMAASAMDIGPTYPTRELLIRIDYVWASAALAGSIRWCRRWQTEETAVASDHLPVLAEIDL